MKNKKITIKLRRNRKFIIDGKTIQIPLIDVSQEKKPRQYSLVKFNFYQLPKKYPFTKNGVYVFLGEIVNMPGHCIVIDHKTGKIYSGYHTENFVECSESQL